MPTLSGFLLDRAPVFDCGAAKTLFRRARQSHCAEHNIVVANVVSSKSTAVSSHCEAASETDRARLTRRTMSVLLPHGFIEGFLPTDEHDELLVYAVANEARFKPAKVMRASGRDEVDPLVRTALKLRDLGALTCRLHDRFLAALPDVMKLAGASGKEPRTLELELTAYGEGAFYSRHFDIRIGAGQLQIGTEPGTDRVISAVYYAHTWPKAFAGGVLRLYPFGAGDGTDGAVEIEATDNRLAVFPSWAPHEVLPVRCPSGEFRDYRFAINCWYCRAPG